MASLAQNPGSDTPSTYPSHWEADVVLRDGSTAHVRPVTPADADGLQKMHSQQSERSIYLRYFTYKSKLTDKELRNFTEVDHQNRVCLVVERRNEIVGIGRFDRLGGKFGGSDTEAEVAFNIRDDFHGRGLGSILLEHLVTAGRELGIERFTAEVLPENRAMLTVFQLAGFDVSRRFEDGVVMVDFPIDPTDRSREVMEAREHRAEALSLAALMRAESVAVVGAINKPGSVAGAVVKNIRAAGFTGTLHCVDPYLEKLSAEEAEASGCVASLREVGDSIDVVVAVQRPGDVIKTADDAAVVNARGLVVISSGFDTPEAFAIQRQLVQTARNYGMRVIGPASLGYGNNAADVRLHASVSAETSPAGGVGLFSHSAASGIMLEAAAQRRGVGISSWVNSGNRADVSGNDLMQYWEDDEATNVVAMYLESFGNPRKFTRLARRLSASKPVIVAKSETMGLVLPPGHAVRQLGAPVGVVDAMLRQAGVVRVSTQDELMDTALLFSTAGVPQGPKVALVSNSSALAMTAADLAAQNGLEAVSTDSSLLLAGTEDPAAIVTDAVTKALENDEADAVSVVLLPAVGVDHEVLAEQVAERLGATEKPVVACLVGVSGAETPGTDRGGRVTVFATLSTMFRALGHGAEYAAWQQRDWGVPEPPEGIDVAAARALVAKAVEGIEGTGMGRLSQEQTAELLGHYGLTVVPSTTFEDVEDAVAAANEYGYPVALKVASGHLRHRMDMGGVRLGIGSEEELRQAIEQMREDVALSRETRLDIQPMVDRGQACTVISIEDPLMGPVVSFGLSGDAVDLLDDWAHATPPLSPGILEDMISRPKTAQKLTGYHGLPHFDTEALKEVLHRISELKEQHPEVVRMEFIPLQVMEQGVAVLSAAIYVGNPDQRTDSARRSMSIPQR